MHFKHSILVGTSMLCLVASMGPAFAQDTGEGLGEIIVTAQKRTENLQDVPIAVTVLDSGRLESEALTRFEQLSTAVPNLISHPRSGATDFEMRGVGNWRTGEPAVQLYIDGVYQSSRVVTSTELPDVESVQVLKGPQGTLFGRNATAGVIALTTQAPPETFEARVEATLANYETWGTRLWAGGPISDSVGGTFSLNYSRQGEGWGTNLITGDEVYKNDFDLSTRSKLVFTPTEHTEITLIGDYANRRNNRFGNYQPFGDTTAYYNLGAVHQTYTATSDLYDSLMNYPTVFAYESYGLAALVKQDLWGGITLSSITSYRDFDDYFNFTSDGPSPDPVSLEVYESRRTATQEFQLTSPESEQFNWVAGVFFYNDDYNVDPLRVLLSDTALPALEGQLVTHTVVDSAALYAQGTYSILDDTRLTLGARYTHEERDFTHQRPTILTFGVIPGPIRRDDITINRTSWRLALEHDLTDDVMVYASFSTGFKSGGYAPTSTAFTPFEDETLEDIELGFKSQLFENRLRLNAAVFHYDFQNIQLVSYASGAGATAAVSTGGPAEIYGLDLDLQAQLTSELSLNAGLGLLQSEFVGGPDVLVDFLQPNPDVSVGGNIRTRESPNGNELPFAPNVSGNVGVNYDRDLSFGGFNANAVVSYIGEQFAGPDNFIVIPETTQLSASVSLTSPDGRYTVQVWGRNLTDETVYGQVVLGDNGNLADLGEPRTFGVTLKAKFGG